MPGRGLPALLHLADSALPIGGFAQSEGLEALAAGGLLDGEEQLGVLLAAHRRLTLERGDVVFVRRAHRAMVGGDAAGLRAAAEVELASRVATEQRAALLSIGSGLLRAASAIGSAEERERVEWAWTALQESTPRGSVFGAVAAVLGVEEAAAAEAHTYLVLAGMVAAAVRLGRVAPFEGQAALRCALTVPVRTVRDDPAADVAAGAWGLFSPLLDVASMRHELLEPRLFAS